MHSLAPEFQELIDRELALDETSVWIGQPVPCFFVGGAWISVLMAIPVTFFAVFWMGGVAVAGAPWFFVLFGLPFVLFGLRMFCEPLVLRREMKRTVYVITDKRAIIFIGKFFSTEIVSYAPEELTGLLRNENAANGTGDIFFNESNTGFVCIHQAREVERLLKDLAATAPKKPQSLEQLDDPPILHIIAPTPRDLPLLARLYLRLCSSSIPILGWFIGGFGFMFVLIACIIGVDDVIPRIWTDAGKAKITNIEEANFHINEREVYAYHFEAADQKTCGVSYGYKGKYKIDDEVSLQQSGRRCRVEKLTLAKIGESVGFTLILLGVGSLLGIFGLCFPIYSWFTGDKAIRLLYDGAATKARHLATTPTNIHINEQAIMKVEFEYQVDGETYTASAHALDVSRLTNAPCKVVLYDPMQPNQSVVLDGLPQGIQFDEFSRRFSVNPLRCVLPLLAATIVCGEIVAIVVLVVLAI